VTNEMAELAAQAELQAEGIGHMAIGSADIGGCTLSIGAGILIGGKSPPGFGGPHTQDRELDVAPFSCSCGPSGANNECIIWMAASLS
jgi:hypothetical protein